MQLIIKNMEPLSHVESILINEINNQNAVYLYLENGCWCAYERSAYYLARLNTPVSIDKEIVREGYDVILLKASLASNEISLPIAKQAMLMQMADDKLLFQVEEYFEGFPEWKKQLLTKLPA